MTVRWTVRAATDRSRVAKSKCSSTLRRSDETKSRFSHQSAVPTVKRRCLCCRIFLYPTRRDSFVMNIRTKNTAYESMPYFFVINCLSFFYAENKTLILK